MNEPTELEKFRKMIEISGVQYTEVLFAKVITFTRVPNTFNNNNLYWVMPFNACFMENTGKMASLSHG
jgi:hypothetical protein